MLPSSLAFLAGICLLCCCPRLPDTAALLAVTLLVAPAWLLRRRLSLWPALILAGFSWAAWHATQLATLALPLALQGQDLEVRGVVTGPPQRLSPGRLRLRFLVHSWRRAGVWQDAGLPVRLTWYHNAEALRDGERWQLRVRLKRAHGLGNPGGFDYERWLFAQGIRATGYVRGQYGHRRLAEAGAGPLQVLRRRMLAHIEQLDIPTGSRALIAALALGERSRLSPQQWQLLKQTGTSHLLAISGLHVGLVAGLVFLLAERLWRWSGGARWLAAPRVAALVAMLAALAYALLSGFQVPAQRATVMIWAWMAALLATGETRPWPVFGLALWVILLRTPLAVLTAGFWLSFGAVALILYLCLGRHGRLRRGQRALQTQLGLVAGLTPLLWLWFRQAALVAPLANLVAIPWISLLVVPLLLCALLLLPLASAPADALLGLASLALQALWQFLEWLDFGEAGRWRAPPLEFAGMLLFALGLLVLLLPAGTAVRALAALLALPALTAPAPRPSPGDVWMTLLDVGQGLAVVVETHTHLLVFDTGPAYPGGFDSGARVVAPFLHERAWQRIDRLVISHSDNDHSGGAEALAQPFAVGGVDAGEPAGVRWTDAADCRQQPGWQWDNIDFEYLVAAGRRRGNNASCVLQITTPDGRALLLPGDIEAPVEQALLATHPRRLSAQVLVAPHHGSDTSSLPQFIDAVQPRWTLFASGYANRFGFPQPAVVQRYRSRGVRTLNTAASGAILVRVEAGRATAVNSWRRQHPRIWRDPG